MIQRKDWLKTDAGKLYKARTNKNYRQKKQQTKKDNLKVNKSFEFHSNKTKKIYYNPIVTHDPARQNDQWRKDVNNWLNSQINQ